MTEIVIDKIVPAAELPKNCYMINLTSMSGDGDHYEGTSYQADTHEDAQYMLTVFWAMQQWQEHGMTRITGENEAEINSLLTALGVRA